MVTVYSWREQSERWQFRFFVTQSCIYSQFSFRNYKHWHISFSTEHVYSSDSNEPSSLVDFSFTLVITGVTRSRLPQPWYVTVRYHGRRCVVSFNERTNHIGIWYASVVHNYIEHITERYQCRSFTVTVCKDDSYFEFRCSQNYTSLSSESSSWNNYYIKELPTSVVLLTSK